ncbi:hypothetical protein PDL71_06115 [Lacibacter sp. MH-610]|uniref:hypothetical protein n=1 Tax=Lacibacter sp. MH-610 TaxID=3020883 RepID=UPI0038921AF2
MQIKILEGSFSAKEALDILTQLVHVKIRYHETKIQHLDSEEDIKMREKRIQQLQKDLYELRTYLESGKKKVNLLGSIEIR